MESNEYPTCPNASVNQLCRMAVDMGYCDTVQYLVHGKLDFSLLNASVQATRPYLERRVFVKVREDISEGFVLIYRRIS